MTADRNVDGMTIVLTEVVGEVEAAGSTEATLETTSCAL